MLGFVFESPSSGRCQGIELGASAQLAYFPFGGGQRLCIGRGFALLETILVLATVARRYRLRAISDDPIAPIPSFTLRPRGGVPLRVEAR